MNSLLDYKVEEVISGRKYKVRQKKTGEIFRWEAHDCGIYTDEQLQIIFDEVSTLAHLSHSHLLRYFDTVLHKPASVLYLVVEFVNGRSLEDCVRECKRDGKVFSESFLWNFLHYVAKVCRIADDLKINMFSKCVDASSVYIDGDTVKIDCFRLDQGGENWQPLFEIGRLLQYLCYTDESTTFRYSDDLKSILDLTQNKNATLDALIYHPSIQINLSSLNGDILIESHDYVNVVYPDFEIKRILSPTLSALALELPGFRPKIREFRDPHQITEDVLNQQWMSRMIAIKEREEALNRRERDLIDREIASSPTFKSTATLQPLMSRKALPSEIASKRVSLSERAKDHVQNTFGAIVPKKPHRLRSSRSRRKAIRSYEDLDSSLSADPGDLSVVATTAKLDAGLPRPSVLQNDRKKVHFTRRTNPFAESLDVSGTKFVFYELENVDRDGYQVPRNHEYTSRNLSEEIAKFKYLDIEKNVKSAALSDITNEKRALPTAPSRMSIASKMSNSSKASKCSDDSQADSVKSFHSCVSFNTRSTVTVKNDVYCKANKENNTATNTEVDGKKLKSRKSILSFKAPFKFRIV